MFAPSVDRELHAVIIFSLHYINQTDCSHGGYFLGNLPAEGLSHGAKTGHRSSHSLYFLIYGAVSEVVLVTVACL